MPPPYPVPGYPLERRWQQCARRRPRNAVMQNHASRASSAWPGMATARTAMSRARTVTSTKVGGPTERPQPASPAYLSVSSTTIPNSYRSPLLHRAAIRPPPARGGLNRPPPNILIVLYFFYFNRFFNFTLSCCSLISEIWSLYSAAFSN